MSPLVWDLAHIAAYEDLWLAHRHGGAPLLRPELARLYDAFETPRAVRGEIEALGPAEAREYLRRCARAAVPCSVERGLGDGAICEMVLRHELQHTETMRQTLAIAGLLASGRAGLAGAERRGEVARGPRRRVRDGRRRRGLRLRQRAPPPRRSSCAAFAIAPPPGQQRELAALQRGRRLRAARVVVGRGLGLEGGVRHHPPSGRGSGPPAGPRLPRLLVRGRRLRPRARRAPADRGGVGEGGDLDPGERGWTRRAGSGVGVDARAISTATRASRPIPTASTRRSSSATATACCAAARGRRDRARREPRFRNWDLPRAPPDLRRRATGAGRCDGARDARTRPLRGHPHRLPPRRQRRSARSPTTCSTG